LQDKNKETGKEQHDLSEERSKSISEKLNDKKFLIHQPKSRDENKSSLERHLIIVQTHFVRIMCLAK
jgi:hypothetical protein